MLIHPYGPGIIGCGRACRPHLGNPTQGPRDESASGTRDESHAAAAGVMLAKC